MIATLRYKEGVATNDGSVVFRILAEHDIEIIKTTTFLCGGKPKVKIRVNFQKELSNVVAEINRESAYTVSVVKISK